MTAVGHLCCTESSIVGTLWVNFLLQSLKLSVIMYQAKIKWLAEEAEAARHNQTHDPTGQKLTSVKCRAVFIFCVLRTAACSTAQQDTEGLSIGMAGCSYCIQICDLCSSSQRWNSRKSPLESLLGTRNGPVQSGIKENGLDVNSGSISEDY